MSPVVWQVDFQDQESNQRYGVLVIHSPSEVNRAFQPPEPAGSGDRTGHRPSQATSMAGCDEETCLSQVSEVTFTQSQSYKIHVPKVSAIKRELSGVENLCSFYVCSHFLSLSSAASSVGVKIRRLTPAQRGLGAVGSHSVSGILLRLPAS